MNAQLTGELNELESAILSVGALAAAETRAQTRAERRDIHLALIEAAHAVYFLAGDIRRKAATQLKEIRHAVH